MKVLFSVLVLVSAAAMSARAQSPTAPVPEAVPAYSPVPVNQNPPSTSPDLALDPAKVAEYQKRFDQGYALQQQGQLAAARQVYDAILAEQPNARRSLLEAGRVSIRLGDVPKADAYLDHLHMLEPDFPEATELLIQCEQALNHDVKVERLLAQFRALHASGKVPAFSTSPNFVRERIQLSPTDQFVMTEFFDHTADPFVAWIGERQDSKGHVLRQFMLRYDPDATTTIRAKDPKYAAAEEFLLVDDVIENSHIVRIDVYRQIFLLPEYKKLRNTMLTIMAGTMKPIYSQVVGSTANP